MKRLVLLMLFLLIILCACNDISISQSNLSVSSEGTSGDVVSESAVVPYIKPANVFSGINGQRNLIMYGRYFRNVGTDIRWSDSLEGNFTGNLLLENATLLGYAGDMLFVELADEKTYLCDPVSAETIPIEHEFIYDEWTVNDTKDGHIVRTKEREIFRHPSVSLYEMAFFGESMFFYEEVSDVNNYWYTEIKVKELDLKTGSVTEIKELSYEDEAETFAQIEFFDHYVFLFAPDEIRRYDVIAEKVDVLKLNGLINDPDLSGVLPFNNAFVGVCGDFIYGQFDFGIDEKLLCYSVNIKTKEVRKIPGLYDETFCDGKVVVAQSESGVYVVADNNGVLEQRRTVT